MALFGRIPSDEDAFGLAVLVEKVGAGVKRELDRLLNACRPG